MGNLPWYVPDDSDEKNRNNIDGAEISDISTRNISLWKSVQFLKKKKKKNQYLIQTKLKGIRQEAIL